MTGVHDLLGNARELVSDGSVWLLLGVIAGGNALTDPAVSGTFAAAVAFLLVAFLSWVAYSLGRDYYAQAAADAQEDYDHDVALRLLRVWLNASEGDRSRLLSAWARTEEGPALYRAMVARVQHGGLHSDLLRLARDEETLTEETRGLTFALITAAMATGAFPGVPGSADVGPTAHNAHNAHNG